MRAFAGLYEQYAEAVHRYALRRCDRDTAEDVLAQVFAIAWRRRESLPNDPLPWLYGAARRVLAEQRRGERRRHRLKERLRREPAAPEPDAETLAELPDAELAQALVRISSLDREALLLTYWEDLSPVAAAQALGCSRATFAVRLHRARRRLRRQLEAAASDERSRDRPREGSCVTETESI